jgi:hypothetical protein
MDHGQRTMIADKCQWVFSASLLHACAKDGRCGKRQRIIPPFRLGLALTTTCATQSVETIADFHGAFHACWGTTMTYKAFDNPLATPRLADFARTRAARLIGDMTLNVRGCEKGRAFGELRHIVLQDGSSCAMHDGWREVFPGRFKVVKPAAVALHPTMDLRCDAPLTGVVTPDTAKAQACWPEPASRRDSVLFADRGDSDVRYLRRVHDENGSVLIRATAGMHPQVVEALRDDGKRRQALRTKRLKALHAQRPNRQRVARGGRWEGDGHPLGLRLSISWNPRTTRCCSCLTTLPPTRYPLEVICRAYTWRWHVA